MPLGSAFKRVYGLDFCNYLVMYGYEYEKNGVKYEEKFGYKSDRNYDFNKLDWSYRLGSNKITDTKKDNKGIEFIKKAHY